MKITSLTLFLMCLSLFILTSHLDASVYTLYDGSLGDGTQTPDEQGYFTSYSTADSVSATGGITTFSTMLNYSSSFGYQTTSLTLDSDTGYTLSFSLKIIDEDHALTNYTGFQMAISSNNQAGVMLAFWEDTIWAFNAPPSYGQGEGVSYTTTTFIDYDLEINASTYALYANDLLILSGSLRNPIHGGWLGPANMITFGDMTSNAKTNVSIQSFTFDDHQAPPVPEPLSLSLISLATSALFLKSNKR